MEQTPETRVRVSAVVVAPDSSHRVMLVDALRALGIVVVVADDYHRGRELLTVMNPGILITELRLGAYNGLHLALLGKTERPAMKVVVLTRTADPVLQREAVQIGAQLLVVRETDTGWVARILAAIGPHATVGHALAVKPADGA